MGKKKKFRNPWAWVPTLYYAEGIPYVIVMSVSVIMYKRLGISNTDIALYTSWLYLPWVIKPLWSPVVDLFKTKRFWIISMQLLVGAGLAGVALTIPVPHFFRYTLAFFWLLAFSSATHDIAADGFYMLGLDEHDQAFFVGIRSTFYRFAMITGQGLLIILAGYLESSTGLPPVELSIQSNPTHEVSTISNFDSLHFNELPGNLRILTNTSDLKIGMLSRKRSNVDLIINKVKESNTSNGFYEDANNKETGQQAKQKNAKKELSWFSKTIKDLFGKEKKIIKKENTVGNFGIVYFHLSKKPPHNENVIVNFAQEGGSKSIRLVEGHRFEFNDKNWNRPAFAVIQLDPKLKKVESAEFVSRAGNIPLAWMITIAILAALFLVFFLYHKFILPYPDIDKPASRGDEGIFGEFIKTFVLFFKKEQIGVILGFLLLFRLGESQLVKLAAPFMLDAREIGGLGLTTGEVGLIYGTIGILALTAGGLLGGFLAAKQGLKYWIWWMLIAINLPDAVYIYLSYVQPESFTAIASAVAVEQFGYGFGFTAYMLFMIYISDGEFKTAHFAIATGFMALGMMVPGMFSGWLEELIGYQHFFVWVVIATIPAFIITKFIPLDPNFGKKTKEKIQIE
ncbi:muropeptide transporter [bacterium BMS3Abin04]|nr:muropeptide transporter [bacterium BMS3Abin04]